MGVDGILTVQGTDYMPIRVMDKSAGVSLLGPVEVETVKPTAAIRANELIAFGLSLDDLDRQFISFNSKNWMITSTKGIPSPNGELDGEIYLMLEVVDG